MGAFDGLRGDQVTHGYWGHHSATIDWCETNYSHSPYVAEIVNTFTNLPTILLGLYGCIQTIRNGAPKRYAWSYLGLTLIGLGSFGFHASLRWEWQLMDELPMIYVVSYATYLLLDTLPTFDFRYGIWGPIALISWDLFVTLSYAYLPNPIYHQFAFAIILFTCIIRSFFILHQFPKEHAQRTGIIKSFVWGISIFALGFLIWNIDNIFCDDLRMIRESRLEPWGGWILQGHAYWHLMTGYGSFLILTASTYLQLAVKTSPNQYTFNSESWFPLVSKVAPISEKLSHGANTPPMKDAPAAAEEKRGRSTRSSARTTAK